MAKHTQFAPTLHQPMVIPLHFPLAGKADKVSDDPTTLYVNQAIEFHLHIDLTPNLSKCSLMLRYSRDSKETMPPSFESRHILLLDIIKPVSRDDVTYLIASTIVPPWSLDDNTDMLYVYLCDFSHPQRPAISIGLQPSPSIDITEIPRFIIKPA